MASTFSKKPVAYLASGGGSTVAAALEAECSGALPDIRCSLIIVSRSDAGVIWKARRLGFPAENIRILRPREFASPEAFGAAILRWLRASGVELVCQFGWLPRMPANVIRQYAGRIINQHRGALDSVSATMEYPHPDFGGEGMHGLAAIAAACFFNRLTGRNLPVEATTHHVVDTLDGGDVIARLQLCVDPRQAPEFVQSQLLSLEHKLQLSVLKHWGESGELPKFYRGHPLIEDAELPILEEAKRLAIEYVRELKKAVA